MKLPLRIRKVAAAYVIEDAAGTNFDHVYFEEEKSRRSTLRMLTHEEARNHAIKVARLLTDDEEANTQPAERP